MSITLILSNKPSDLNKKLINFFNSNLSTLNKSLLVFDFEVANPDKIDEYVARGITNYPILINNTTKVTGAEKIMKYLKQLVEIHNKKMAKKLNKTDNDYLDDFWQSTMGGVKINESGQIEDDGDDEDDDSPDISKKIQQAFKERNDNTEFEPPKKGSSKKTSHNSNIKKGHTRIETDSIVDDSPVASLKNMGRNGKSMGDDELMARFFENQEES
jgi:hypothetical protein